MSSPKSQPSSTALVAASKPTLSLNRQVVLEEDDYTEALSNIIARDFFPSLAHLEATNSYLTALESNDVHLIDASVRRLENLGPTPTRAQFPGETPLRTPRPGGEPATKRKKYDDSLSLDDFQARYTSEDNASFTEILDEENRKRKERYGWAWDAEKRVSQAKAIEDVQRKRLLIDGPVSDQGAGVRPGQRGRLLIERPEGGDVKLITDKEHAERTEQGDKEPEESQLTLAVVSSEKQDVMAPLKDTRSASVPGWTFKARNSLMFPPDADESPYHPSPSSNASGSKGDPKVILHGNTRLPSQSEETEAGPGIPPSPTRSRIDAAIAGTPYHPSGPKINGFSLVPSLPSPSPSQLGPDAVKQLMTVGTLLGTPRILSGGDDPLAPPDTPFRIAPPTQREAVAHRLSNKASQSLRAKAALLSGAPARTPKTKGVSGSSMAPPTWTPRRAASDLTPAAQRLLERTSGSLGSLGVKKASQTKEGGLRVEKDLAKERWTPTPTRRRA